MGENDYQSGYRGDQFHHGMDRGEYERGKGQKELEATLGGAGRKVEVPGIAYTLILVSPFIWMVYPVLGFTIMAVFLGVWVGGMAISQNDLLGAIAFLGGSFVCVFSFFWGMKLELIASQVTAYRWIRGILRIVFSSGVITILGSGAAKSRSLNIDHVEPSAIVGGFFIAVIVYLVFQRVDLIFFPSAKEIKKMQALLKKGERPTRPMFKRLFFGFCWLIPTVLALKLLVGIVVRLIMEDPSQRATFSTQFNPIITCASIVIWYILCLIGKLPGTGKYMFSKRHEEDILDLSPNTSNTEATWSQENSK